MSAPTLAKGVGARVFVFGAMVVAGTAIMVVEAIVVAIATSQTKVVITAKTARVAAAALG